MASGNTSRFIKFSPHIDKRGILAVCEGSQDIPFEIKRVFWIYAVPEYIERGDHKHEKGEQVIIAVNGKFRVVVDGLETLMHDPTTGILVRKGEIVSLDMFSKGAVALVLCSDHYDPSDVIPNERKYSLTGKLG